jgi:hypothetical protein
MTSFSSRDVIRMLEKTAGRSFGFPAAIITFGIRSNRERSRSLIR